MTDERIRELWETNADFHWDGFEGVLRFVRAVLKEAAVSASIADTAGAKPAAQVSIRDGFIVGGINYGLAEGKHELFAAPPAPSVADAALSEKRIDWIANAHCPTGVAYPNQVKQAIREALREASSLADAAGARITYEQMAEQLSNDGYSKQADVIRQIIKKESGK